ncbi:MAG: hypothetical protein V1816_01175 [Pseudomonadota bacterium]
MKKIVFPLFVASFIFFGQPALAQAPAAHHPGGASAAAPTEASSPQPGGGRGMKHDAKKGALMKCGMMEMMHGGPKGNMMEGGLNGMMMRHMTAGGRHGDMMMSAPREKTPGWDLGRLNLTPEQWQKVRTLAHAHIDKLQTLAAEEAKLQLENAFLLGEDKLDEERIKQTAGKLGEVRAMMALTARSYLDGLSDILNEAQLEQLAD